MFAITLFVGIYMLEAMLLFKPEEEDKIPNRAGVYAFLCNPFERSRLGLFRGDEQNQLKIQNARAALKIKLSRLDGLKKNIELQGGFVMKGGYSGGASSFSGILPRVFSPGSWADVDAMSDKEFVEYLEMAEKVFLILPALYCGMTVCQGLRSRFLQHKRNYMQEEVGSFGGRLAYSDISWSDIRFLCVPITSPSENENRAAAKTECNT